MDARNKIINLKKSKCNMAQIKKANTTGKSSKYAEKKEKMKNGTYHGNSPFFENIPEFQFLRPLSSHPHLADYRPTDKQSYQQPVFYGQFID